MSFGSPLTTSSWRSCHGSDLCSLSCVGVHYRLVSIGLIDNRIRIPPWDCKCIKHLKAKQ
ncbi:hypothetical protein PISMIDRAFT_686240 [Pisolithus microcarpus 441]|uniref:Unplaced genomic scaffold scaffold_172, whole genome shotgun sequence n=1 Tax=Pisolithus microcarpus 441 TaxID=765257 RepID=A0A0C9Z254_9AGAM|nr:hypothetical protein PISMIDRAFT_686240 [Pisolithus microcarpus 441]